MHGKKKAPLVAGVDRPVSAIALGTAGFGREKQDLWFELLDGFAAGGGTAIDTAYLYGDSEGIIGAWMQSRGNRDRLVLCTKGAHGKNMLPDEGLEDTIEQELTTSLERLRTDCIDLYWLHRDNPSVPAGRIVDCLNGHLDRGRIRAFGASNWDYERVERANEYAGENGLTGFAAISNNLSLAVQTEPFYEGLVSVDKRGLRWHTETGIPLFSWSSQARGFFTGRYRPETHSRASGIDDPLVRRMVEVYCTEKNFERLRRAEQLGREKGGYSAVQIALAWLLHRPIDVVPIVGPRTAEELASCLGALSIELTEREIQWLNLER